MSDTATTERAPRPEKVAVVKEITARLNDADAVFVSEYRGKFRLGVEVGQHAARDVDVASRQGEGVDGPVVHDTKGPVQVRPLGDRGHPAADALDVVLEVVAAVQAHLGHDRSVGLEAHRHLLRLADQHDLALARGRVDGAAGGRQQREKQQRKVELRS